MVKQTGNIMLVNIYIPNGEKALGVAKGSGIVGIPTENGMVKIYFEGNIYQAVNLHRYRERVMVAAFRMKDRCMTVAFDILPSDELVKVGQYDTETNQFVITSPELLTPWERSYAHFNGPAS